MVEGGRGDAAVETVINPTHGALNGSGSGGSGGAGEEGEESYTTDALKRGEQPWYLRWKWEDYAEWTTIPSTFQLG